MWPFTRKPPPKPEPIEPQPVGAKTQDIVVAPAPLEQKEWRLGQITSMFEAMKRDGRKFNAVRMDEFMAEIMKLNGALIAGGMKARAQQYMSRLQAAGIKL